MRNLPRAGLAAAAALFVLDQLTKWLVTGPLGLAFEGDGMDVLPIFRLRNVHNHGVSLGFLQLGPSYSWVLVLMTGVIAVGVLVWMWRETNRQDQVALGLVLGGALGNIVDRQRLTYVQDFADLHFGGYSPFLVFNLADAAITIGVLILLVRAFLVRDKPPAKTGPVPVENPNA